MGLDMLYQAVPDEREWWKSMLANSEIRQSLARLPHIMRDNSLRGSKLNPLETEANALMRAYPGIQYRNFPLHRSWDQLHYLLSENRQYYRKERDDQGSIAIFGERELADDIRGGQGVPVRYISKQTVSHLCIFLDQITETQLRESYVPQKMEQAKLYKFVLEEAGEPDFESLLSYFQGLQRFYSDAAEHKEGVLVCLD